MKTSLLLLPLFFFFFLKIVLVIPVSESTPISFDFQNFSHNSSLLLLQGNATLINGSIAITEFTDHSVGHVTYHQPLHLYDNHGNLASFSTYFSFVIDAKNTNPHGDGFTFFLVPNTSSIPYDNYEGSILGLMSSDDQLHHTTGTFVAVEFDTYKNDWDPDGDHVGIDINFLKSIVYENWMSGSLDGRVSQAWISYDSSSSKLDVRFTNFTSGDPGKSAFGQLTYQVNLSQVLGSEWVTFGFSASTGSFKEHHKIFSWSFSSTFPNTPLSPSPVPYGVFLNDDDQQAERSNPSSLVWGTGIGVGVTVFSLVITGWLLYRRKSLKGKDGFDFAVEIDDEFGTKTGPRKFLYHELARATNNFEEKGKLGEGGFGCVYKGLLKEPNLCIAVKRVSKGSKQGLKEYASEVRIISHLRHRNLVQLIGWCHDKGELLLAYEFMPNKSLDWHLFESNRALSWETRFKIVQGLASALLYLHELGDQCVLHRDIKSSNIMLDSSFNAKLGDFGLARLVDHQKGSQTTVLAGTFGYMAPECLMSGKSSKESDVYSFGVVALEIACGKKSIVPNIEEGSELLLHRVWGLYGSGKFLDAVDARLKGNFTRQAMECLMMVGMWCAHPDSTLRPSIGQAIKMLNRESPMPHLPLEMPILRYVGVPLIDMKALSDLSSYTFSGNGCGQNEVDSMR